jgi:hypothetical protein
MEPMQRRRFKNVLSFPDRLTNEADRLRKEADALTPGPDRDELLKKARQLMLPPTWTNGFRRRD